ncbi:MAG: hemerythrin family protein [Oligoflexia bacterium]|nr:hemerythrin family protein [Oligoflexia bacterium]MBF0363997.1 hemerythrin family protein [Oligoflexia bacterium]
MDIIAWSNTYSVEHETIDKQHQRLIEMVNALFVANNPESVSKILNGLVEYTVYHFDTEDKFMQEHKYPQKDYDSHKKDHIDFIAEAQKAVASFKADDQIMKENLLVYLTKWLKNHILTQDKKLGEFLSNDDI